MPKKKYAEKFVGLTPKSYEKLSDRYRKVLEIFSHYKFERILDVGCGDGNFTALVGKACGAKEVYGVDISEKGVEIAKKNGIKAFRVDVDEEDLPFEDNYFDAVLSLEVIEHLFDPDHYLDEIYRVLKPNGIFVLSTPNLASYINRIALLLGYQPFYTEVSLRKSLGHIINSYFEEEGHTRQGDHIRMFTLRSLKELLKMHKFKPKRILGTYYGVPQHVFLKKIFLSIARILPPSLSIGLIVVAEVIK